MGANFQDNAPDSSGDDPASEQSLQAREEELRSRFSYARTLIQYGRVPEALTVITETEASAQRFWEKLPADVRYLPHFLRGRAYLQQVEPALAQPHLEAALEIVREDQEAAARVRNLLGVVYLEQQRPDLALKQHLECLDVALAKGFKDQDRSFRLSVYRNLANDYLATNNILQAIDVYKQALVIMEDHHDLERQAGTHWGLAMAYQARNDWTRAMAHGIRSVDIYESIGKKADAASVGLNLAEMLTDIGRYGDAERLLNRVKVLLDAIDNLELLGYFYIYRADLARKQKVMDNAKEYSTKALELAEALIGEISTSEEIYVEGLVQAASGGGSKVGNGTSGKLWIAPVHVYIEALGVTAMVEEDLGHEDAADRLFKHAVILIQQIGFRDMLRTMSWKYAKVLSSRGAHGKAVEYYSMAVDPNRYTPS
ncbi:MAG TPA: tetratricopeptide repeat protein [Chloroflexia bacterium]|jgi:tetratricopeptide (TPR) repeat protein